MMKGTVCIVSALVLLAIGTLCWAASGLDRDLAAAQWKIATLDFDGVEAAFDRAEKYYGYASYIPGFGKQELNEVRARRASMQYWQRRYASIVSPGDDPVAALPQDNTELQLITANAVYRTAQAKVNDRTSALQAIDVGIKAYLAVLKNSPSNPDAAFNYEFLLQQRGALLAGSGKPKGGDTGEETNPHGQPGGAPQQTDMNDFKIQIPVESKQFEDQKEGQDAGKTGARQRKG